MIAYHLDRFHSLHEGQTVTLSSCPSCASTHLFNGNVSIHGQKYLSDCYANDFNSYFIEYTFELVRQKYFPQCLSRFQSFFALEHPEDILLWPELLVPTPIIWEIEIPHENFQKFDANLLLGAPCFNSAPAWSPEEAFSSALRYWNGEFSTTPKPELLIQLPVTVKTVKRFSIVED